MSYKILEANGVDNENIDGGALNNLIVKDKNGIVNGVLSECALSATGSLIGISPGLLILHGIRVKITATETLTLANVPATATKYQIVAQVVLSADRSVAFSFLVQEPIALKQDELYATNEGTYQIEFGTFTQNADGTISELKRTVQTLYESETQMREDLDGALADITTLKTAVEDNAKGIAENAASIDDNARNIAQNSAHIQNLYSIARENNQFAVLSTEQAYTTRQTADGAEIFDEQYTPVLEIKGSTVADSETNTLKHAFIKAIKSTGRNLIHLLDKKSDNVVGTVVVSTSFTGKVTIKGTATQGGGRTQFFSEPIYLEAGKTYTKTSVSGYDGLLYLTMVSSSGTVISGWLNTFTVEVSGYYCLGFNMESGKTYDLEFYPMLNRGTLLDFEPYTEDLYELPQELTDLYPDGIPEYDRFNPQTGEIVKGTGQYTFTGNENWAENNISSNIKRFEIDVTAPSPVGDPSSATLDVVCSHFKTAPEVNSVGCWVVGGYNNKLRARIIDTRFTTLTEFTDYLKAQSLAGTSIIMEYKLATPTITKIENAPKQYKTWKHGSETIIQGETDNSVFGAMPTIINEYFVAVGAEEETNE